MLYPPGLDKLDPSQLGLLYWLALKGIMGNRVNRENDYYRLYTADGGDAALVGWLGVLLFGRLIERAYDKGEDWYRITREGVDYVRESGSRNFLSSNPFKGT